MSADNSRIFIFSCSLLPSLHLPRYSMSASFSTFCLLSLPLNPFLCLKLQLKSPPPMPRAAQSLLWHGSISLFQIQLLLYTQPRDYISKENRKPNTDTISFIISPENARLRNILFQRVFIKFCGQVDSVCCRDLSWRLPNLCTLVIHGQNSEGVKKLWQQPWKNPK